MKCDRCKNWHQRTFICHNEGSGAKGEKKGRERICGSCICSIWGVQRHEVKAIIKGALE